jgi:hypothetical protein
MARIFSNRDKAKHPARPGFRPAVVDETRAAPQCIRGRVVYMNHKWGTGKACEHCGWIRPK